MKKYLIKYQIPLQQLVKRLDEEKRNSLPSEKRLENDENHFDYLVLSSDIYEFKVSAFWNSSLEH